MPNFYDQFVGWAEETVWGTLVPRTVFSRVAKGSFLRHVVPRDSHALLGRRDTERFNARLESGVGKLIIPAAYTGLDKFFKHGLGATVTTGVGPYVHTHKLSDGPPFTGGQVGNAYGLSLELHSALPNAGSESWLMYGGKIQQLGANIRVNDDVYWELDVVGQKVVTGAKSVAPTYADLDTYLIKPVGITISVDGASQNLYGVNFTLNNNVTVEDRGFLGSQYIAEPVPKPGKRTLRGQIEREWLTGSAAGDAITLYNKFISGATASIVITMTGPTNYSLVITIPKVVFMGETPEPEEGGVQKLILPWEGQFDATDTMLKFVSSNQSATI